MQIVGSSTVRIHQRWVVTAGLIVTIIAGLLGAAALGLGGETLPDGVVSATPLEYAVGSLYLDQRHKIILAIYGSGLPLPHGHHFVVIGVANGRILHDVDLGELMPSAMAVDARIAHVLVTFSNSTTARLIDSGTGRLVGKLSLPFQPLDAAYDGENGYALISGLASIGHRYMVSAMDLRSGVVIRTVVLRAQGPGYGTGPAIFDSVAHRVLFASPGGVNILDSRTLQFVHFTPIIGGDPDKIVVDSQIHQADDQWRPPRYRRHRHANRCVASNSSFVGGKDMGHGCFGRACREQ